MIVIVFSFYYLIKISKKDFFIIKYMLSELNFFLLAGRDVSRRQTAIWILPSFLLLFFGSPLSSSHPYTSLTFATPANPRPFSTF
jgi:hypothetical protein